MRKIKAWFKGRLWYRPEYKKANDIVGYITLVLVAFFLINQFIVSINSMQVILYGCLLACAGILITLSEVDRHEQKLSQLK